MALAAVRGRETSRPGALLADPHALALSGVAQGSGEVNTRALTRGEAQDIIATRYLDECLVNALDATSVNTISRGDYRQVVVVGDGMDTRLWRLPVPEGTVVYCCAPAEVHARAEGVLRGLGLRQPRGTLLKRVGVELQRGEGGGLQEVLERAGFRGDRLSVWIFQGLHQLGLGEGEWEEVLVGAANLASHQSLLAGELPPLAARAAENMLAEAGFMAALVAFGSEDADYDRWEEGWGVAGEEQQERRLFSAQQVRMSLEEIGVLSDHSAAMAEADEDFFGNFS